MWWFPVGETPKIQLRGLIPINSYAVNAVIEPGAPIQFTGKKRMTKAYTCYWTKRPAGEYTDYGLGWCGIGIEPVGQ